MQSLRRLPFHVALVESAESGLLASQEHVLNDVEVVAQRQVLIDDLDAERRRLARVIEMYNFAVELHDTRVVGLHTGKALDQGRFASSVVADQRRDFARERLQADTFEHAHRSEALLDVTQFDDGLIHEGFLSTPGRRCSGELRGGGTTRRSLARQTKEGPRASPVAARARSPTS